MRSPELDLLVDARHALLERRSVRRTLAALARVVRSRREIGHWGRQVPILEVRVTGSRSGRSIARGLSGRRWGVPRRWAVSVLHLPAGADAYFAGRSRQAVRTNRARARTRGLGAAPVTSPTRVRQVLDSLGDAQLTGVDILRGRPWTEEGEFWELRQQDRVVGVAHVSVDREVARLNFLLVRPFADKSEGRYLLCTAIIEDLIDRGVSGLLMESSVFLSPGLLYFQRRLGFDICTVRVRQA